MNWQRLKLGHIFVPPVIPHVEEISADGMLLDREGTQAPPGARRLSFSFTGLDLKSPSRVRFRYRLDSVDKDWSEVTSKREATYIEPLRQLSWVERGISATRSA